MKRAGDHLCSSDIFLNNVQEEMVDFVLRLCLSTRKLFASEDEGFAFYNKYAFDK
jgi:hypothetical protein